MVAALCAAAAVERRASWAAPGAAAQFPDRLALRAEIAGAQNKLTNKWVIIELPAIITASDLRTASAAKASGEEYVIRFALKATAAERFAAWTAANINQYLGVVLNDEVRSIAFIKSPISDQGEISGHFTQQSAEDLALVLKSGSLPFPIKVVNESTPQ